MFNGNAIYKKNLCVICVTVMILCVFFSEASDYRESDIAFIEVFINSHKQILTENNWEKRKDSFWIGSDIPTYEFRDGCPRRLDFRVYPILDETNNICFLVLLAGNTNKQITITGNFVDDLNRIIKTSEYNCSIALLYFSNEAYVLVDNRELVYLSTYQNIEDRNEAKEVRRDTVIHCNCNDILQCYILNVIGFGHPIIAASTNGYSGHSVVLRGIDFSGYPYFFSYMDPNPDCGTNYCYSNITNYNNTTLTGTLQYIGATSGTTYTIPGYVYKYPYNY